MSPEFLIPPSAITTAFKDCFKTGHAMSSLNPCGADRASADIAADRVCSPVCQVVKALQGCNVSSHQVELAVEHMFNFVDGLSHDNVVPMGDIKTHNIDALFG